MDKAVELLHQAKQKYSEKALEEAERLVKEAKAYWPNHADVLSLEKTIQDERKQAADTIAAIMKDIQDKKMYAAQTKIDQAKANGFSIDPSVAFFAFIYMGFGLLWLIDRIYIMINKIKSTLLMLPNNFYLLMMMIELVFVGAYKILVNLIPHKTNGVPNDGYIVKMLDAHIAMRKDYALYLRIYADTFLNKAISPSDYQYERNESLSDDELLYYNEIQEILKSINAQMSKHEIDHCKGIVI